MKDEQYQVIQLTEGQQNPYLARPEDFTISEPDKIASRPVPFHGQCGDTAREYEQLLAIRASKAGKSRVTEKGVDLPIATDEAGSPHRP